MRIALFSLLLFILPAAAQDALPEPGMDYGAWKAEPGNDNRAATLEHTANENLSYGFSCWKNHWLFFFNYQAPAGGKCEDHEECETNVTEVNLTFEIPGRPVAFDRFTLFENYYFQDQALSVLDIEAMINVGHFQLKLDEKLKTIWEREDFYFALDGFEKAVNENQKLFSCVLHAPIPMPLQRPAEIAGENLKENEKESAAIAKAHEKTGIEKAKAVKAVKSALGKKAKAKKAKDKKAKAEKAKTKKSRLAKKSGRKNSRVKKKRR
jgi:hypothetical protein